MPPRRKSTPPNRRSPPPRLRSTACARRPAWASAPRSTCSTRSRTSSMRGWRSSPRNATGWWRRTRCWRRPARCRRKSSGSRSRSTIRSRTTSRCATSGAACERPTGADAKPGRHTRRTVAWPRRRSCAPNRSRCRVRLMRTRRLRASRRAGRVQVRPIVRQIDQSTLISPSTGSLPPRSSPLPQPHTSTATVLVNELDAGDFKSSSNDIESGATRLTRPSLQLVHGYNSDSGFICKLLLAPSKKSPGCPALFRSDHPGIIPQTSDFYNSIRNILTARIPCIIYCFIDFIYCRSKTMRYGGSNQRHAFIGGSDARIIMGSNEAALLRLWREKRGEAEPEDLSGNLIVQLGAATEELNRSWYERNTGRHVTGVQRRVRHSAIPWMVATLDGIVEATGAVF